MPEMIPRDVKLDLIQRDGIVGVGEGVDNGEDVAVITIEPWAEMQIELPTQVGGLRVVVDVENEATPIGVRQQAQEYPVDTQHDALRPIQPGVSIGPTEDPITSAGTVSFLLTDEDQVYVPSNNHVLADVDGQFGNMDPRGFAVSQPSPFDGGGSGDVIGEVDGFVNVDADIRGNVSTVDMAWASLSGGVEADMRPIYMPIPSGITNDVDVGDPLLKVGRTTGVVEGHVKTVNDTRSIRYSAGGEEKSVPLEDQITATMANGGGDSGAPVIHVPTGAAVGIACASSDSGANASEDTIINRAVNWESESGLNLVTAQRGNAPSGLNTSVLAFGALGIGALVWGAS